MSISILNPLLGALVSTGGVLYCWEAASFTATNESSALTVLNSVLICLNNILKAINIHIISPGLREKALYRVFIKTINWTC